MCKFGLKTGRLFIQTVVEKGEVEVFIKELEEKGYHLQVNTHV